MKNYVYDVCLVAPLHDPEARLAKAIRTHGKELKRLYYGYIGVKVTKNTHEETLKALKSANISYSKQATRTNYVSIGRTYKEAITLGIKMKTRHIHVCDLDRVLHWIRTFPNELHDIVEYLPGDFGITWIGRTKRAFETHPATQKETEKIVNDIAEKLYGDKIDIMTGAFAMDRDTAKLMLKHSKRNDFSFFSEFLVIALEHEIKINTTTADGLEWETPDQYSEKIQREGYQDWLEEFMSLPEWKRRIELMGRNSELLLDNR